MAGAVQETAKVPLRQALVDCPAFRDGLCVYDSSPCKYKGRGGECRLQVKSLNHSPCPFPFQDWPLSCCSSLKKPFVKARRKPGIARRSALTEIIKQALAKGPMTAAELSKNIGRSYSNVHPRLFKMKTEGEVDRRPAEKSRNAAWIWFLKDRSNCGVVAHV